MLAPRRAAATKAVVGLIALALLAHIRALWGGWIWDDDANVTNCAPVLAWSGLARIWLSPTAIQQYYPIVHTSFWLEHKLWGLHPLGFHATNVLLHALNTFLVWRVLRRLGLSPAAAWIAGALFAVHPVHVESVAWVTERKNTLSFTFYAASALWWLRWRGLAADDARGEGKPRLLAISFVLFLLALLAKSATSTLPLVLLVIVWWKRGRWERRELWLLPYFLAAILAGLLTIHLEYENVGTGRLAGSLPFPERLLVAGRAFWFYASKLALPLNLNFVYPRWSMGTNSVLPWLFPLAVVGLLVALFVTRDRIGRGPLAAVLAWAITLAPTLGFIDVFFFRYSYVSDHFQYHASAAAFALAGAGLARLGSAIDRRRPYAARYAFAVLLLTLAVLSARRVTAFRDERTLWTGTLQENPRAWIAWNNLGQQALDEGRTDEAEAMFHKAIGIDDGQREPWNNLGVCLLNRGRPRQAVPAFEQALAIHPGDITALENLGRALLLVGQLPQATTILRQAVADPRHGPEPVVDLIEALAQSNQEGAAVALCRDARQRFPDAAQLLEQAIALRPGPGAEAALRRHLEWVHAREFPG